VPSVLSDLSVFTDTPERTRATYIAVVQTYSRSLARTHTTYLAVAHTLVCEPNQIILSSYVQVSFFLWGFLMLKNRSAMMVFGGQKTTKKLSQARLVHFLRRLERVSLSSRKELHVYRDNRRHRNHYRVVAKYHAYHYHRTTKR